MAYAKSVVASWPVDEGGNPEPGWQTWEDYEGSLNMKCMRCEGMQVMPYGMMSGLARTLRKVERHLVHPSEHDPDTDDLADSLGSWIAWLESMPNYD